MTMIKIRYRDQNELSPGLHAAAERHGRATTVYLLSGLSATQRRAALRRLRISARRGYGPRLPAPQLTLALLADRVRTAAGRAGAVFRSHPAGSTVPVMAVSAGAIVFLALSAVSIRVIHRPSGLGPPSAGAAVAAGAPGIPGSPGPAAPGRTGQGPGGSPGPAAADRGDPGGQAGPATGRPGSRSSPGGPAPAASGSGGGTAGNPPGGPTAPAGSATGTPGGNPATVADPVPAASPSAPGPSATPTPLATPGASQSGQCQKVSVLGICL
jgi:hypothetical protein